MAPAQVARPAGETAADNAPDVVAPPERPARSFDDRRPPRRDSRPPQRDDRGDAPRPGRFDGDFERRPARAAKPAGSYGAKEPYAAKTPRPPRASGSDGPGFDQAEAVMLAFNIGRNNGVRPGDLVGAITNESGITSRELGAINITPSSSMVEVAGPVAATVVKAMKGKTIRGELFEVKVLKRAT